MPVVLLPFSNPAAENDVSCDGLLGQADGYCRVRAYYDTVHAPLTLKVPGVATLTTGKCESLAPDQDAPYLVANIDFETAEDLKAALASPEVAAAGADAANFATGGVTLFRTEQVTRR